MAEPLIAITVLRHSYLPGTPMQTDALQDVDLTLREGEVVALVGPSGAGKSTLAHHMNGLLRPAVTGHVRVLGQDTASRSCDVRALRRQVGLVFQHPHQQMLEQLVGDDIAYGPAQLGLDGAALRERVHEAMEAVGLPFERYVDRQTFALSGGEMRRVALAGVLALRPRVLVMDEATTGLDPAGREQVLQVVRRLHAERGIGIVIISNDMDEVAGIADRVVVLFQGRTVADGPTREVLGPGLDLPAHGLLRPTAGQLVDRLAGGGLPIDRSPITLPEAEEAVWQAIRP